MIRRGLFLVLALLALLAWPAAADAQIVNPTSISVTPSPHHSTTGFTGDPKVAGYRLKFYLATDDVTTATPVKIVDVGKPAIPPLGGGVFTVGKALWASAPLVLNTDYKVTAEAYGPGGTSPQSATSVATFTLEDIPAAPAAAPTINP